MWLAAICSSTAGQTAACSSSYRSTLSGGRPITDATRFMTAPPGYGSHDFDGRVLDRVPVVDGAESRTSGRVRVAVADVERFGQAEGVVLDRIEQLEPLGVAHRQRELQVGEFDRVIKGRVK